MISPPTKTRWMAVLGCYGLAAWCIKRATMTEEADIAIICSAGAVASLLGGTALLIPDILGIISRAVDAFYFPGGKLDKPVLSYKLPEFYRREQRYEESLQQYNAILEHYPHEVRAWIGAVELLMEDFGNREQAEDYYRRGHRQLKHDREALDELEQCWRSLSAASVV